MTSESNNLHIGLLDNACHSLKRGYEIFNQGRKKKDHLALKEAIIWIHHGIELSIKQLLFQSNEYLIFDNVDEAVRKLAHLRKQPEMNNSGVLDLFESSEGVYTVGFGKLIDRAAIMLNLTDLSKGSDLRERIDALTIYRNKIVHFTVQVDINEVISLLANLVEPFLTLLEREVMDENFVTKCAPLVRANAESLSAVYRLQYAEAEERIEKILLNFRGMEVSGDYFGVLGRIVLPNFETVNKESRQKDLGFDLLAKSETETWIIELKLGQINATQTRLFVEQSKIYQSKFKNAKSWLVLMGTDKVYSRALIQSNQILVSSEAEIIRLEKLLNG